MNEPSRPFRRDIAFIVAIVAGLMALAVAVEMVPWSGLRRSILGKQEPVIVAPRWEPQAQESLSVQELWEILKGKAGDPAAARFAEEFMKDPVLSSLWENSLRKYPDRDAKDLLHLLRENDGFRRLLDRFSTDKDFNSLLQGLAANSRLNASLRQEQSRMQAAGNRLMVSKGQTEAELGSARLLGANTLPPIPQPSYRTHIASMMNVRDRAVLQGHLEKGKEIWQACEDAKMKAKCEEALNKCREEPTCADSLKDKFTPPAPKATPPGPPYAAAVKRPSEEGSGNAQSDDPASNTGIAGGKRPPHEGPGNIQSDDGGSSQSRGAQSFFRAKPIATSEQARGSSAQGQPSQPPPPPPPK